MARPDTICALSSGALPSGVAVVRLSGSVARSLAEALAGPLPPPRRASLRSIRTRDGALIDNGLVLLFPAPESFTGEDCVEFQVHGGRAVVAALLGELTGFVGVRLAEAGEFTLRAFLNGRLDLTQAEALADLVEAETEVQRRQAIRNAGGAQRVLYEGWRERLIRLRAMLEAELDFGDEAETESAAAAVREGIGTLKAAVETHLEGARHGEIARDGFRVAIIGAPNAGKSTLFNALLGREAAIVTAEPGTTRDVIEANLDIGGQKIVLQDTAGIRSGPGSIEAIGIERARAAAAAADLVLLAVGPGAADFHLDTETPTLKVVTKADLGVGSVACDLAVSAITGSGMDVLAAKLADEARRALGPGDVAPTRLRHKQDLQAATASLDAAIAVPAGSPELVAEHLRLASDSIGRITGAVGAEDLLDVIFSSFCIGK